ncbi:MAG: hypothetical protein QW158_05490 [Nitrososphaerales archaeon]
MIGSFNRQVDAAYRIICSRTIVDDAEELRSLLQRHQLLHS